MMFDRGSSAIGRIAALLADQPGDHRNSIWQMVGQFFRELGVLIIVFYPIDSRLAARPWLVVTAGLFSLTVGIAIERRR